MKSLLRLYPRRFRERYGAELQDLLESQPASLRDAVDLIQSLAVEWLTELRERRPSMPSALRLLAASAILLAACSLVALGYVVNDLAGGVAKVHRHWWSTIPVLGLLVAALLGACAAQLLRRRAAPS